MAAVFLEQRRRSVATTTATIFTPAATKLEATRSEGY